MPTRQGGAGADEQWYPPHRPAVAVVTAVAGEQREERPDHEFVMIS